MKTQVLSVFLSLPSLILALKLSQKKDSGCDEINPVFGNKTCLQICDKKNGSCKFNCNKKLFDSCDQTCVANSCGLTCNVKGFCLQNCNKGCKSSCNSGTCKQLCSNGLCDLKCSGRVCEQSCSRSSCRMKCNPSAETCIQNCMSGAVCRKVKCRSKRCNQACAKEGCSLDCRGKQCHQVCTAPGGRCKMTCLPGVETCVQLCPKGGCVTECHAKKCVQMSQALPKWNITTSPHPNNPTHSPTGTEATTKHDVIISLSLRGHKNIEQLRTNNDDSDVIEGPTAATDSDDVKWPTEYSIVRRVSPQKIRKEKNTSNKLYCSCPYILVSLFFLFVETL